MEEHEGYIHSIETFGSVDGPGVRFVVFVSGCPFRCAFCHNPDTWDMSKGSKKTPSSLLEQALRYRPYWKTDGGITVSGGEPLMQLDFLIDFFTLAKKEGVNTCIDTAGGPFTFESEWFEKFKKLMSVTDLLLVDIKHIEEEGHKNLTQQSGINVKEMLKYLSNTEKPVWIRHVLVPGITDKDELLLKTRDFIRTLKNIKRVEVLPYHTLGITKYKQLGIDYKLKDVPSPNAERIANAKKLLETDSYTLWK